MKNVFYLLTSLFFFQHQVAAQALEIWQIQGEGLSSAYKGQRINTVNNVVTARGSNFFFMQCPASRSDNNPSSSDGMMVLTSSSPTVKVGDMVSIEGIIIEENNTTAFSSVNLSVQVTANNQELPPAVALNSDFPMPQRSFIPDLERVEGMRLSFTGLACGPPEDRDWIPVTTQPQRPFREPGILYPGFPNLPVWDGNPELFWLDLDGLGQPNDRFIAAEMQIQTLGIMVQIDQKYVAFPITYSISGANLVRPVRPKENGEFTIGSINTYRLLKDATDYDARVKKMALYIVNALRAPDILALQEIGGVTEMEDLAFYIRQLAPQVNYQVHFLSSNGDIHTAFLIQSTLTQITLTQLSKNEFLSIGGTLHDRPPLLLSGQIMTSPPTPIYVLNLHLRSLLGIEGGEATFVRTKRYEQALSVAGIIQNLRQENLVVVGDFNAYPFSDGYVDVVNQIAGTTTLGALFPQQSLVHPPLIKHADNLPATDRYSFVFEGNAQLIDHCLSTELTDFTIKEIAYARGNADNSWIYGSDPNVVERSSDHDGLVLFLQPNNAGLTAVTQDKAIHIDIQFPNPMLPDAPMHFTVEGNDAYRIRWIDASGRIVHEQALHAGANQMQWSVPPSRGLYFVQLIGKQAQLNRKVILQGQAY
ncbi:MAG: endonuclease/exonuclease/phosphatase family protein [Saprospiraceae bacterium]